MFDGEAVTAGNIIARQRGTKWHAGRNVGMGKDHTLFALIDGKVQFANKAKGRSYVSVVPMTEAAARWGGNWAWRETPVISSQTGGAQWASRRGNG